MLRHFYGSLIFAAVCFGSAALYGYANGGPAAAASALWIAFVLGILEISLSFDNAVVNASVLKTMSEKWQRAFLTWGVVIAVFGMRIVFPLLIVAIAGSLGPVEVVHLAMTEPARYAAIVAAAHTAIMGFGGAFLMLVGLKFFFDAEKQHDWIGVIERPLRKFGDLEAFAVMVALALLYAVSTRLEMAEAHTFLVAGVFGIVAFFAVEWIGNLLEKPDAAVGAGKAGFGAFLYLEVLDASFSFDGVIGSFAMSNDLIIIALGLGVGAIFVRSMTIYLVRTGTLSQFRFLEHGAFYAIVALAMIMLVSPIVDIPETVTGLIGAGFIGFALWSSIRYNRVHPQPDEAIAVTLH